MSKRFVVTALGPDGKVIVQATYITPDEAIMAFGELLAGFERGRTGPAAARRLLALWLTGGEVFEVLSPDYQTTYSITIIED